jgi:hypothetical protein
MHGCSRNLPFRELSFSWKSFLKHRSALRGHQRKIPLKIFLKRAPSRPVRRGVSKGVEYGHRLLALRVGQPRNGLKAVSGVARPQGVEGLRMAGPGETLGSPWIPLAIQAWSQAKFSERGHLQPSKHQGIRMTGNMQNTNIVQSILIVWNTTFLSRISCGDFKGSPL